jgi:hypothetical protein
MNGAVLKVNLRVQSVRVVNLPLQPNWNLVSWSVRTADNDIRTTLAPVLSILRVALGFGPGGLTFDPSVPFNFATLRTTDALHGYWLKMNESAVLSQEGLSELPQTPIMLDAGYNLVSYLPPFADSIQHALAAIMDKVIVMLGFDGVGSSYYPSLPPGNNTLAMMTPGMGYWIKLREPAVLIYPTLPFSGSLAAKNPSLAAGSNKSVSGTLPYIVSNEWMSVWGDSLVFNGVPLQVGAVIRAYDPRGTVCGEYAVKQAGKVGMMNIYAADTFTKDAAGPKADELVTLKIGSMVYGRQFKFTGLGDLVNLKTTTAVDADVRSLPKEFALNQNYPNPFNPATMIRYALPRETKVRLEVMNLLGQRIEVLVDQPQPGGYYTVTWNAHTAASGVYFFRLMAGDFVSTRKMMLMR